MLYRNNFSWQAGALLLFGGLYALIGFLHEPWRDKAQAWMIVQRLPGILIYEYAAFSRPYALIVKI